MKSPGPGMPATSAGSGNDGRSGVGGTVGACVGSAVGTGVSAPDGLGGPPLLTEGRPLLSGPPGSLF